MSTLNSNKEIFSNWILSHFHKCVYIWSSLMCTSTWILDSSWLSTHITVWSYNNARHLSDWLTWSLNSGKAILAVATRSHIFFVKPLCTCHMYCLTFCFTLRRDSPWCCVFSCCVTEWPCQITDKRLLDWQLNWSVKFLRCLFLDLGYKTVCACCFVL